MPAYAPPVLENILVELLEIRSKGKKGSGQRMKVYFGFTVAGDRSSLATARRMVEVLEAMGHEVLTRHLVEDDAAQLDRSIPAEAVFERDMNWLRQCDIFIAEVSGSSFGLGFETGYVLGSSDRQAVLFYRRDAAPRISLLITGNTHPNCVLEPYGEAEEMEARLRGVMGGRGEPEEGSRNPRQHVPASGF